jgi:hypothetical protein
MIYLLLSDVPHVPTRRGTSMALTGVGGMREDPVFSALKAVLPDATDAEHFLQAVGTASYFVTTDARTILSHAAVLAKEHGVLAVLPSTLLERLRD